MQLGINSAIWIQLNLRSFTVFKKIRLLIITHSYSTFFTTYLCITFAAIRLSLKTCQCEYWFNLTSLGVTCWAGPFSFYFQCEIQHPFYASKAWLSIFCIISLYLCLLGIPQNFTGTNYFSNYSLIQKLRVTHNNVHEIIKKPVYSNAYHVV